MDLVLDIGNSAVKGALFPSAGTIAASAERAFRLDLSPAEATPGDWQRALDHALDETLAGTRPERAGLASVVPAAASRVEAALHEAWGLVPFRVSADARLPFALAYRTPATLGADRLAAAAGAWTSHAAGEDDDTRRPVVALDAGTALTAEAVRAGPEGGVYEGGAIAPGPALAARALAGGTAQLPELRLEGEAPGDAWPEDAWPPAIGATTREALRSGLLHGLLDTAEGLIRRFARVLGPPAPIVVSTGGWGALLHARSDRITRHDPHLVLRGVRALLLLREVA